MNKKLITIIVVIMIGAVGIGSALLSKKDTASNSDNSEMDNMPASTANTADPMSVPVSTDTQEGSVELAIKDFAFSQTALKVKKGTKVTWTNRDSAKHDIKPDEENTAFVGSGELLAKDESYSFTFEAVGKYNYHCTPHPYMKASIEVVE